MVFGSCSCKMGWPLFLSRVGPAAAPAVPWKLNGSAGPSATELRLMGATNSVSFRKSTKQGVLRPLSTLPPFVPRLFIEDITLNHDKYRGFDAAGRDLTAASKTLQPSIIELQVSAGSRRARCWSAAAVIASHSNSKVFVLIAPCYVEAVLVTASYLKVQQNLGLMLNLASDTACLVPVCTCFVLLSGCGHDCGRHRLH